MTRENRVNVIFVLVLLAVSVPGAVIMVRKRLASSNPNWMPDAVRRSTPYIDASPAPPQVKRIVPTKLAEFVESLVRGKCPADVRRPAGSPVMSEKRLFQVIGWTSGSQWKAWFIVWNPAVPAGSEFTMAATAGPVRSSGRVTASEIKLPDEVQRELVETGMIQVPQRLTWVEAEFQTSLSVRGEPVAVVLGWWKGESAGQDSATLSIPTTAPSP